VDRKVVWLEAALDDLDQIAAYIAGDSPRYASVVVGKMLAFAAELGRTGEMGRMVPEWGQENVRERIAYSYRLIYRLDEKRVVILGVIHGARLLPKGVRNRD